MSDLFVERFMNSRRPVLDLPALTTIPVGAFSPEQTRQIIESLAQDANDSSACARAGRLWEEILTVNRHPFLLLRVADMRTALNSPVTGLQLYLELEQYVKDKSYSTWLKEYKLQVEKTSVTQCLIANDPEPYCRLQKSNVNALLATWKDIQENGFASKYINDCCLETNDIENAFGFDRTDFAKLVNGGFNNDNDILCKINRPIRGDVRNTAQAIMMLQDTHAAVEEVMLMREAKHFSSNITVETICALHRKLMRSTQVLCYGPRSDRLSYFNIGKTRQESRTNAVSITSSISDQKMRVQFCPWDSVRSEMELFCTRLDYFLQDEQLKRLDPFALAAWISHVFTFIHPFEVGNGRISRLLSSLPLIKRGLPPISVGLVSKSDYIRRLNEIRANRDGDYSMLMTALFDSTTKSLSQLTELVYET